MLQEGRAVFYVPDEDGSGDYTPRKQIVFYNPLMRMNRDIAVLVLRSYKSAGNEVSKIADPMAGCGVRGIRFVLETPFPCQVYMNDLNPTAARLQRRNIELNGLSEEIEITALDANLFLSLHAAPNTRFDFVDLDPFGSPVRFLDSAVRSLRNGGLLAVTATDMAVLCGVHPAACRRKYFSKPLRTEYCHELAVRILLGTILVVAARYEFGITPLFSHSSDHYIRTYLSLNLDVGDADRSLDEIGYVAHCFSCFYREPCRGTVLSVPHICPNCGKELAVAGPLWLGDLFYPGFVERMQRELSSMEAVDRRLPRLLRLIGLEQEAPLTYYVIDRLADRLNVSIPPTAEIFRALADIGYQVTPTHFRVKGLRTDAPSDILLKTIRRLSSDKSSGQ